MAGVGFRIGVGAMGNDAILIMVMQGVSALPRGYWLAIRLGARITACSCSFNYITMVDLESQKRV